jgi:hypothetical protein
MDTDRDSTARWMMHDSVVNQKAIDSGISTLKRWKRNFWHPVGWIS